jgi:hypothetical protein
MTQGHLVSSAPRSVVTISLVAMLILAMTLVQPVHAQTTVTAYQSQRPVKLDGVVENGEWNDTQMITDPTSGMTIAFKQNGTGILFLMIWSENAQCSTCYAALELGSLNNTGHMGSPTTITIMILLSPSYKGNVDEAISAGEQPPTSVEQLGFKTQSVCALAYSAKVYTAECYRPFKLTNASPHDFNMTIGTTLELGLAVGDFDAPGTHQATDMSTYVLSISNQTYTPSGTTTTTTTLGSRTQPLVIERMVLTPDQALISGVVVFFVLFIAFTYVGMRYKRKGVPKA